MSTISWNCRGLGNPRAIRALKGLIRLKEPKLVFLMETKMEARRVLKLKLTLGYPNGIAVDSTGRSGGLALF